MTKHSAAVAVVLAFVCGPRQVSAQCGKPYEIAAGTPREAIAKMVVDRMFNDIVLTAAQQNAAVGIVTKAIGDLSALDRTAPDYQKKYDAITSRRNADLLKLLPKEADRAKLNLCFESMKHPARGG